MNKTVLKIFAFFILSAVTIIMILLAINFGGFAMLGSDVNNAFITSPRRRLENISKSIIMTDSGFQLSDPSLVSDEQWCVLINENGDIIWAENMPDDIPQHYTINDIAVMSKWYVNDYPVYVRAEEYGLLVLGYPKNAVGKYQVEYSMNWFETLPARIITVLLINIILAAILACVFGAGLYKRLKTLTIGINDLKQEKAVKLKEKGILKELSKIINDTSKAIERKNMLLTQRDQARHNWIAGISHDIRTPLSMIMGYSESLSDDTTLPDVERKKAEIITAQSIKIKKLVEDLNLISSLEYDLQPLKRKKFKLCTLMRHIVSDMLNSGIAEQFEIDLDLQYEKAEIYGDESLIERAVFNIINNSIIHNPDGCMISIKEGIENGKIFVLISDNGEGVPDEVIAKLFEIPKTAHGLGLPMAYKIINVHGGTFIAYNDRGFHVRIDLPIE